MPLRPDLIPFSGISMLFLSHTRILPMLFLSRTRYFPMLCLFKPVLSYSRGLALHTVLLRTRGSYSDAVLIDPTRISCFHARFLYHPMVAQFLHLTFPGFTRISLAFCYSAYLSWFLSTHGC